VQPEYEEKTGRIFFISVVAIASVPWLLYAIGLMNVSGRPEHATLSITDAEAERLWNELREIGPVQVSRIGPWDYVLLIISDEPLKGHPGMKAAGFLAGHYNSGNIYNKRMAFWHLSNAAITIWLSRNWTTREILSKVKEINNRNSSGT